MITQDTTIGEIAKSGQLQKELTELILSSGVRIRMQKIGMSYDNADKIAESILLSVGNAAERIMGS